MSRAAVLKKRLLLCAASAAVLLVACDQDNAGLITAAREARQGFEQALTRAQTAASPEEANEALDAAAQGLERSKDLYQQADAGASTNPAILAEYAEVLRYTEDVDLAAKALARASELKPKDPDIWLMLGQDLAAIGPDRRTEAIRALTRAAELATNRQEARARAALALQYWRAGLYDLARRQIDDIEGELPFEAALTSAALDARSGAMASASATLDAAGEAPPQYAAAYTDVLSAALDEFQERRISFPDTAEQHAAYGKLLLRTNRVGQSIPPLRRAAKLDRDASVYWNLLGSAYRMTGNPQLAVDAYRRSLEANPDQPRTRQVLEAAREEASALGQPAEPEQPGPIMRRRGPVAAPVEVPARGGASPADGRNATGSQTAGDGEQ